MGLALGAALLGVPWTVHGIMLAGTQADYEMQQRELRAEFTALFLAGAGQPFCGSQEPVSAAGSARSGCQV